MSDLKDKAKDKIDAAAKGTKDGAAKVIDKSEELAHQAGDKMQEGAKNLKNA